MAFYKILQYIGKCDSCGKEWRGRVRRGRGSRFFSAEEFKEAGWQLKGDGSCYCPDCRKKRRRKMTH